ncbi:MAG: hypothetical protein KAR83_02955 [Thermodesulfovibrionales bacterium]|nr:hypothetical protein [Thermodesulfovibrionales bacterium]
MHARNTSGLKASLGALAIALALGTASVSAEPVVVAEGITPAPGAVAWSPDSMRLAYAAERLTIYNTVGGEIAQVPVNRPYYITWLRNNSVAALFQEGENTMLALLAPDGRGLSRTVMPPGTTSVHEQPFAEGFLIAQALRIRSITPGGIETHHALHVLQSDGSIVERFATSHAHDRKTMALPAHEGWLPAGPGPLAGRMLLLEYLSPQDRNPYTKLSIVDPVSGHREDLLRTSPETLPAEGSWSPGGRAIALPNSDSKLRTLSMDGTLRAVDETLTGDFPAWSPAGSQIYFGGSVVMADGSAHKEIIPSDRTARGFWRPDGTGLAILTKDGTLSLHAGITTPMALPGDAPPPPGLHAKFRLLSQLLAEGLITTHDYTERAERLREGATQGISQGVRP